jgi:hypothetical protein
MDRQSSRRGKYGSMRERKKPVKDVALCLPSSLSLGGDGSRHCLKLKQLDTYKTAAQAGLG